VGLAQSRVWSSEDLISESAAGALTHLARHNSPTASLPPWSRLHMSLRMRHPVHRLSGIPWPPSVLNVCVSLATTETKGGPTDPSRRRAEQGKRNATRLSGVHDVVAEPGCGAASGAGAVGVAGAAFSSRHWQRSSAATPARAVSMCLPGYCGELGVFRNGGSLPQPVTVGGSLLCSGGKRATYRPSQLCHYVETQHATGAEGGPTI
jgi:hypothetical protein